MCSSVDHITFIFADHITFITADHITSIAAADVSNLGAMPENKTFPTSFIPKQLSIHL